MYEIRYRNSVFFLSLGMVSRFAGMVIFANITFDQFLNLGRIDIAFLAMTNLNKRYRIKIYAY